MVEKLTFIVIIVSMIIAAILCVNIVLITIWTPEMLMARSRPYIDEQKIDDLNGLICFDSDQIILGFSYYNSTSDSSYCDVSQYIPIECIDGIYLLAEFEKIKSNVKFVNCADVPINNITSIYHYTDATDVNPNSHRTTYIIACCYMGVGSLILIVTLIANLSMNYFVNRSKNDISKNGYQQIA